MRATGLGLLSVHSAALLFGGTALFSRLVDLPALHITWWRALIAAPALVVLARLQGHRLDLGNGRHLLQQAGIGVLLDEVPAPRTILGGLLVAACAVFATRRAQRQAAG
ncbi:MAG: hypothetical protein ACOCXJ_04755 [Planctomycetota bacterium]